MAEIEKVKLPNDDTIYDIKDAKAIRGLASGTTSGHVLQFSTDGYTVSDSGKSMSDKQDTIDSSHKLSADLIDDTSATNKFATAAQLTQIETNKTNISSFHKASGTDVYYQETEPTEANVGDYWLSTAGNKIYDRTEQLFDINNSSMFYNGYINNNLDTIQYSASGSKTAVIPVTVGEKYTIAVNSKTLRIACIATTPSNDTPILEPYRQAYDNYDRHSYTITVPETARYLLVNCYISTVEMADDKSINDIFGTLMINEGETAMAYKPYYDWQ